MDLTTESSTIPLIVNSYTTSYRDYDWIKILFTLIVFSLLKCCLLLSVLLCIILMNVDVLEGIVVCF